MCDPSGLPYFSTALRIPAFRKRNAFFVCLFVCLFVWKNPKSWALESGIQLKDSGVLLSIGIRDPLSQEPTTYGAPDYLE